LVARFGHSETVIIPNTVRYTVAGYNAGIRDHSNWTCRVEWETRLQNVERQTGMTFVAVRHLLGQAGAMELMAGRSRSTLGRRLWGWIRGFRSQRKLLTERQVFTEIDYTARPKEFDYPPSVSLPVMQRGQLNIVVFQQDLMFDDLLIRTRELRSAVYPPQRVEPGDVVVLSTGEKWERWIPLAVERKPARS
jgi:hypothetical protein